MNLKEALKDKLDDRELSILKTALDIVGDIAIIDVPEELEKKEKIIAKAVLDNNRNIKTVVKKSGIHEGIFRLQPHKYILGEDKKKTMYKENGCTFEIDIDKTYFSPRSSTERQRICNLVKAKEDILVMFSGIAPLPIVISKNTDARYIWGIELNKDAHEMALHNVKMNKANNVFLINDDAHKVREFYNLIIGMKPRVDKEQYAAKYSIIKKYNEKPIIELYVHESDLKKIDKKTLLDIRKHSSRLVMHQCLTKAALEDVRKYASLMDSVLEFVTKNKLDKIIDSIILHPFGGEEFAYKEMLFETAQMLKKHKNLKDKIFFENIPHGGMSDPYLVMKMLGDLKMTRFCYDIGHHNAFLAKTYAKNNKKLSLAVLKDEMIKFLDSINLKEFEVYFHVRDVLQNSAEEGVLFSKDGFMSKYAEDYFKRITYGIIEVFNKDEKKAAELEKSLEYIKGLNIALPKKFDRILMPLPKDAELFLADALYVSKKGTMIHLYHFSHVKELEDIKSKILDISKNAGKKIKFKDTVRCGDFSPDVHRWCFDIEVQN